MLRAALVLLAAVPLAGAAQVADPAPDVPVGTLEAEVAFVVALPDSGPGGDPTARPMHLGGDGAGRTFVADQNGIVYQIHPGGTLSVFLDVAAAIALLADQGQRGLSSFAFHPDHHVPGAPGEGRFYTAVAQSSATGIPDHAVPTGAPTSHHSVIHEWTVGADPDAIDPGSAREVLRVAETYADHNVGRIGFDPTLEPGHPDRGLLYVAFGDGGNTGYPPAVVDPHLTGQSLASPLGAIVRIDPLPAGADAYTIPSGNPFASDGDPSTLGEIWAYGLRNPHAFSWDRGGTHRMLISDIGQSNLEEIDVGAPGANYGWSEREGTYLVMHDDSIQVFPLPPDDAAYGYTYPALQYDHDEGDRAVSGGFVVRSDPPTRLEGRYVFGDLVSGRVFHAPVHTLTGTAPAAFRQLRLVDAVDGLEKSLLEMIGGGVPAPRADLRFGLDDAGTIHLLTKQDGSVRRLQPEPLAVAIPGVAGPAGAALALLILAASRVARGRRTA